VKTRRKAKDKIHVITLGCSKNTVDSEKLMAQLNAHAVQVQHNAEQSDARTVIINTCGFINDAKQESVDTILEYINAKEQGLIDNLYVMGCLSERYAKELKTEMPEVDQFFGVNNIEDIVKALGYDYKSNLVGERLLSTPSHYAYLKIAEGCNRKCSFCAIPLIRGKYESFAVDDLLTEAKLLAKHGVKELLLIAQDTSYYGMDIQKSSLLTTLLEKLSEINEIEWIRLHYAYPAGFPKDVIDVIASNPKMCKYLDIPVQHISDNMLKIMRRGLDKKKTIELIENFRSKIPGLSIRTTLLVGHPGETEADFEELYNFVCDTKFDRLGIFTYSHEEDTYAARHYKDSINPGVKQERANIIMKAQQEISLLKNRQRIAHTMKVVIDNIDDAAAYGRTQYDSPEVDNEVIINNPENIKVGSFYDVKIIEAGEFDLEGELVKP